MENIPTGQPTAFISYFNTYIINAIIRVGFDKAGLGTRYTDSYSIN